MEARFRHWKKKKKKKGNFDFLSHNSDFFLAIVSLHFAILLFSETWVYDTNSQFCVIKSELRDVNSQFWEKKSQ